jgi:serine protease AprX
VHKEFRAQPEMVKEIFLKSASDLKRHPHFQGAGMVDLLRAVMSV